MSASADAEFQADIYEGHSSTHVIYLRSVEFGVQISQGHREENG